MAAAQRRVLAVRPHLLRAPSSGAGIIAQHAATVVGNVVTACSDRGSITEIATPALVYAGRNGVQADIN